MRSIPFELLIEAADQQLMLLCISALLTSDAGELALQFLRLILWGQKNKDQCAEIKF